MRFLIFCLLTCSSLFSDPCCSRAVEFEEDNPSLLVFVSFSVPEESWKQMSHHLEKIGGQFILRGMPHNSFEDFLKKVLALRKKGVCVPITIDPDSFETYGIDVVPAFVLLKEDRFAKVVGNITVPCALEIMEGDLKPFTRKIQ